MSVFRRAGRATWEYDFKLDGRRYTGSTKQLTRRDAEDFETDLKRRARRRLVGLEPLDTKDTPFFSDWAVTTWKWQRDRKKIKQPHEAKNTLRMILAFWGAKPKESPVEDGEYRNLRLGDPIAKPELIEEFEKWMTARGLSGSRKNHYRSACSMLYRVALYPQYRRKSGVRENPFSGVMRDRVQRRTTTLEPAQLTRWLEVSPLPVAIAVVLGILTGLRLRGVVELTRKQISPDLRFLSVPHKADRYTGLPLTLAVSPRLRAMLRDVFAKFPDDPYVVPLEGERYWQLVKLIKKSLQDAEIPYGRNTPDGITFHSLRHTLSTWLARWGVNADARQRALGHETPAMQQWYTHLVGADTVATMTLIGTKLPITAAVRKKLPRESVRDRRLKRAKS